MSDKKPPLSALRRKARHYGVQALYQWQMAKAPLASIEAEFRADNDMRHVDVEYFHEILFEVPKRLSALEALFGPHLDRDVSDVGPVELAVLRMATYELEQRVDIPYKVVLNEAVSLTKKFGPEDSHKFINGVLDKVAQQLRQTELAAKP